MAVSLPLSKASVRPVLTGLVGAFVTTACAHLPVGDSITTSTYEATATVTYTWQVEYTEQSDRPNDTRRETFTSTSLVNRNGLEPDRAATGPDDQGLYWPALPPRPTATELRASQEKAGNQRSRGPQLIKDVDYAITFDHNNRRQTLPTNADVYWEAIQAYDQGQDLELTYGPNQAAIAAAQPVRSSR
ncbi:hypothetical protein C7271_24600 [filamentous cyanobacterium CCP5]|nr:hypothetical protein C7271_24600 [filamentous cyanobacterium CCP5]